MHLSNQSLFILGQQQSREVVIRMGELGEGYIYLFESKVQTKKLAHAKLCGTNLKIKANVRPIPRHQRFNQ